MKRKREKWKETKIHAPFILDGWFRARVDLQATARPLLLGLLCNASPPDPFKQPPFQASRPFHTPSLVLMLRRAPTEIKLTAEDVLEYDDAKIAAKTTLSSSFGSLKAPTSNASNYDESPLSNNTQDLLQELSLSKTKEERVSGVRGG